MNRSLTCLAALLLSATLVSCSNDEPRPKFAAPETTTATPTDTRVTTPTEPPTTEPVALSPEGTVRAWVKAQNKALLSGAIEPMKDLVTDSCVSCRDFSDPIEKQYADGGHLETTGWQLDAAKKTGLEGGAAKVDVGVTIRGGTNYPSSGAEPIHFETSRHIVEFSLESIEDRYKISFIGFIS